MSGEKIRGRGRRERRGKILPFMIVLAIVSGLASRSEAVVTAQPKLKIDFYYNDNVYFSDPDELETPDKPNDDEDIATATYINYLAGILFGYRHGMNSAEVSGYVGYSQYVNISGWVEDAPDDNPADYNSFHAKLKASYTYTSKNFIFGIDDTLTVTRNLQDIFGLGVDAMGYWALYTDNVVGVSVKIIPSSKSRLLMRYTYDNLDFAKPENDAPEPPDSVEQRGVVRFEYDFSGKTTGIIEGVYGTRTYESTGEQEFADYSMYFWLAGIRYWINSSTHLVVLGGHQQRTFSGLPDNRLPLAFYPRADKMYDVEDFSTPMARITLNSEVTGKYEFSLGATHGVSTYGQNLYFTFWQGDARFIYYFIPNLYFSLDGAYSQSVYDLDLNSREWLWDDDRIDYVTTVGAKLTWDIFQKGGEGTLTLAVGYEFCQRDSNIDSRDDYTVEFQNWQQTVHRTPYWPYQSHDGVMSVYYVEFIMLPTLLLGD